MIKNYKLDVFLFVLISLLLTIYRITHVDQREISWDVLGYYMPLPATFIYDDPMLNNVEWLKRVNEERNLTGTLYMVSSNEQGQPMYFFLFGMSILFLPFFMIGHFIAGIFGYVTDGFSMPYQYAMVAGGILYTLIGLFYLRKILRYFFSEMITGIIMILIVFGTNYIHHLTVKNLETVNILFMLVNIIIWYTIKWHEQQKLRYLLTVSISIVFITLVKPSEVFVILIPLLWNISSAETFKEKMALLAKNKLQLLAAIICMFVIALPQLMYWHAKTGHWVYDTYKNPGVGLDFWSPHIFEVLFSYRKGWLLYTPIMIFSLIGFFSLLKKNKQVFPALFLYFLTSLYIISSWTEWWYGAAFSNRPLIATYPVLAVCLGYFLLYLQQKKLIFKLSFGLISILLLFLNQFQWWQLKRGILDPYRTTKKYYWATFLKTSAGAEEQKYLMVGRDFSGQGQLKVPDGYFPVVLQDLSFDEDSVEANIKTENGAFKITPEQEYILTQKFRYKSVTGNDHLWVKIRFDIRFPKDFEGQYPCLITTMDRKEGNYGYYGPEIKPDSTSQEWKTCEFNYLTPDIRDENDILMYYIWNRGKRSFYIDNFRVSVYQKNDLEQ